MCFISIPKLVYLFVVFAIYLMAFRISRIRAPHPLIIDTAIDDAQDQTDEYSFGFLKYTYLYIDLLCVHDCYQVSSSARKL